MTRIIYQPTGDPKTGVITTKSARQYNLDFLSDFSKARANVRVVINLSGKHMTFEGGKCVANFISSTICGLTDIVDLSGIVIVGEDARYAKEDALKILVRLAKAVKDSKLIVINLSNNYIGNHGIDSLATILSKKSLERVQIQNAGLEADDIETLVEFLRNSMHRLTHISLNNNNKIGEEGAVMFASLLGDCSSMIHFELGAITPGVKGTKAITQSAIKLLNKGNKLIWVTMKGAKLGPNDGSNGQTFKDFVSHLNLTTLEFVDVSNSSIDKAEQHELKNFLLERNPNLYGEDIHLGQDSDNDEVVEESQFVQLSMRG